MRVLDDLDAALALAGANQKGMAVSVASMTGYAFSAGTVFEKSFAVVSRVRFKLFPIVIVAMVPGIVTILLTLSPQVMAPGTSQWILTAAGIIGYILGNFIQAVAVHATVEVLKGRDFALSTSLGFALRRLPAILGLGILIGLGAGLGAILLIIPGLMLITRWYVAVPALLAESLGVQAAMGRSAELTKGSRWSVFGIFILLFVIAFIAEMPLDFVLTTLHVPVFVNIVTREVINGCLQAFGAVVATVTYSELRTAREGTTVNDIAEVFA